MIIKIVSAHFECRSCLHQNPLCKLAVYKITKFEISLDSTLKTFTDDKFNIMMISLILLI